MGGIRTAMDPVLYVKSQVFEEDTEFGGVCGWRHTRKRWEGGGWRDGVFDAAEVDTTKQRRGMREG